MSLCLCYIPRPSVSQRLQTCYGRTFDQNSEISGRPSNCGHLSKWLVMAVTSSFSILYAWSSHCDCLCFSIQTKLNIPLVCASPALTQVRIKPRSWPKVTGECSSVEEYLFNMCESLHSNLALGNKKLMMMITMVVVVMMVIRLGMLPHNCNTSTSEIKEGRSRPTSTTPWVSERPP